MRNAHNFPKRTERFVLPYGYASSEGIDGNKRRGALNAESTSAPRRALRRFAGKLHKLPYAVATLSAPYALYLALALVHKLFYGGHLVQRHAQKDAHRHSEYKSFHTTSLCCCN